MSEKGTATLATDTASKQTSYLSGTYASKEVWKHDEFRKEEWAFIAHTEQSVSSCLHVCQHILGVIWDSLLFDVLPLQTGVQTK